MKQIWINAVDIFFNIHAKTLFFTKANFKNNSKINRQQNNYDSSDCLLKFSITILIYIHNFTGSIGTYRSY